MSAVRFVNEIDMVERFRSVLHGFTHGERVVKLADAVELRALIDHGSIVPVLDRFTDWNLRAPKGGRIAPRLRVVPMASNVVAVSTEASRTDAAAPTPFGDALPEGALSLVDSDELAKRVGSWIPVTRGAWSDRGEVEALVRALLEDDFLRALDAQILAGDGTGENLLGILNTPDMPTQTLGADTHAAATVKAVCTIRGAGHVGPVDVVCAAADAQDLVLSADWQAREAGLRALGFRDVIVTPTMNAGSMLVGSFDEGAHLYLRSDLEIAVTDSHLDYFARGLVAVAAESRVNAKVTRKDAFVIVTDA